MGNLISWPKWTRRQNIANLESAKEAWESLYERFPGGYNDLIDHLNEQLWLDGAETTRTYRRRADW